MNHINFSHSELSKVFVTTAGSMQKYFVFWHTLIWWNRNGQSATFLASSVFTRWIFLEVKNVCYSCCSQAVKVNFNFSKVNSTFYFIFLRILRALLNKFLWGCNFHDCFQHNVYFPHWRKPQTKLDVLGLTYGPEKRKKNGVFFLNFELYQWLKTAV